MKRVFAAVGSALFFAIAPGSVAVFVPWWISGWKVQPPLLGLSSLRVVGVLLVGAAVGALLDSFVRFAVQGVGTPAPIFPTSHLVVTGLYRYVRNPMYLAVVSAITGQGLILGSVTVLGYGAAIWLVFNVSVLVYEEPTLRKTFGAEYESYSGSVPRWIPRLSPWRR